MIRQGLVSNPPPGTRKVGELSSPTFFFALLLVPDNTSGFEAPLPFHSMALAKLLIVVLHDSAGKLVDFGHVATVTDKEP